MVKSKISSKGQIVLPKRIRDLLGVGAGDEVRFTVHEGEVVIRAARPVPLERLRGSLRSDRPYRGRDVERAAMEEELAREVRAKKA